jgi:hypothetical protein
LASLLGYRKKVRSVQRMTPFPIDVPDGVTYVKTSPRAPFKHKTMHLNQLINGRLILKNKQKIN